MLLSASLPLILCIIWWGPFSVSFYFYCVYWFYNNFCETNQSSLTTSMTSPVSCASDDFPFYHVFCFLIWCIFCHWTNQNVLMTSLTTMGLNPDPLVCTIFTLFICILTILLVVLVVWGLTSSYQQESSPKVTFLRLTCSYQQETITKVVDSSKCFGSQIPYFISKFETQFYSYSRGQTLHHSLQPL